MRTAPLATLTLGLVLTPVANAGCEAPEHRQFDFWQGEWEVVAAPGTPTEGQVQGHNRIESIAAGCGLAETWRGAVSGMDGRSLSTYDAAHRVWRQFWVGGDGTVLQLSGGLEGDDMVLEGVLPRADGGRQRQRIRWTPDAQGQVTQRWDTSDDDGRSWQLSFLGVYRRQVR